MWDDRNFHEGNLLGCSYNQSCVGVWVVDISRIKPCAIGNVNRFNSHSESKSGAIGNQSVLLENNAKTSMGRLYVSQYSNVLVKETKSLGRLSVSQNSDPGKESFKDSKILPSTGSVSGAPEGVNLSTGLKTTITGPITVPGAGAPERVNFSTGLKTAMTGPITVPGAAASKRSSAKVLSAANVPVVNKAAVIPVIVPKTNSMSEHVAVCRKAIGIAARTMPFSLQSKTTDIRKFSNSKEDMDQPTTSIQS